MVGMGEGQTVEDEDEDVVIVEEEVVVGLP